MSQQSSVGMAQEVAAVSLVDAQFGAVVSREVISKPQGTVTIFAFDQGQELSEHTAPFDAVVEVLEGEALLTIGGKAVPAKAGQTVIMPANISHALKAVTRFKMLLTMIRS